MRASRWYRKHKTDRSRALRTLGVALPCLITTLVLLGIGCTTDEDDGPTASPNIGAFTVTSIAPQDGATDISIADPVVATFNRDLDLSSIDTSSFHIDGIVGEVVASGSVATFTPFASLVSDTTYTVTITTDVTDSKGVGLSEEFISTFNTGTRPVAKAGSDRNASFGNIVTLNGSASTDPLGDSLSYSWERMAVPSNFIVSSEQTAAFEVPDTVSTAGFILTVNSLNGQSDPDTIFVRVFEDHRGILFVGLNGDDRNPGTMTQPFRTIQRGIDSALVANRASRNDYGVYVSRGSYKDLPNGRIILRNGVSVYGGFRPKVWHHSIDTNKTIIEGGVIAVVGDHAHGAKIDGFTIKASLGHSFTDYSLQSSIGIALDSSNSVIISRDSILTQRGSDGLDMPQNALPRAARGEDGKDGKLNQNNDRAPGSGGNGRPYNGGRGGWYGYLTGDLSADDGYGWSDPHGAGGTVSTSFGGDGGTGKNGKAGTHGDPGGSFGTVRGFFYIPAKATGGSYGGGGAGGQGGTTCGFDCSSGSGGGGGGGQGLPGEGGWGAGASFGILLFGCDDITVVGSFIKTARGGTGGDGGARGLGGYVGNGGDGHTYDYPSANPGSRGPVTYPGGDGGNGGRGGDGGYGGGGGGGPSVGILVYNSTLLINSGNDIRHADGGIGGPRSGGNAGARGDAAAVLTKP